jgi:arylsulfatase
MKRTDFLKGAAGLAAMSLSDSVLRAAESNRAVRTIPAKPSGSRVGRPNILWICTDQQRFDTITSLGNSLARTPNIDRLVREGVTFTNAFAQSALCTPSRASMMTGRYPHNTGATGNGFDAFRGDEMLVTEILSTAAGYDCGLIGKLHLMSCDGHVEKRIDDGYRLFLWSHDPFPKNLGQANQYIKWLGAKGYKWDDVYKPPKDKWAYAGVPANLHQTTWCFNNAIELIQENKLKSPWLLNVNVFAPHHPFDPSEEYLKRYDPDKMPLPKYKEGELKNKPPNQMVDSHGAYGGLLMSYPKMSQQEHREVKAAYYAMIEQVDDQVGRLLDMLDKTGHRDNTLIIFTSDHGEMLGNHGIYLKGSYTYDDLIHVPLIMSWPGHFRGGIRSDALVELVDIMPTLLDAAGVKIPKIIQGKSLYGICTGKADLSEHRNFVYAECLEANATDNPPVHLVMVRDKKCKIVVYQGQGIGELYNLEADPDEFDNLWNSPSHQSLKNELVARCFDTTILNLNPMPPRMGAF